MGISRSFRYKSKNTGGRIKVNIHKRKSDLARAPANTKLVGDAKSVAIHLVRCRAGAIKRRGLRLESGNFAWGSEAMAAKSRILDVVYNSSNNELVRTKTLVKNCIVQIDAAPFRNYFEKRYNIFLGKKGSKNTLADLKQSAHVKSKAKAAGKNVELESIIADAFASGRLLACLSSRPGQTGRADGYILEGKELEFYSKKLSIKKK
jgi:small subunit ribosomal protein S8e